MTSRGAFEERNGGGKAGLFREYRGGLDHCPF